MVSASSVPLSVIIPAVNEVECLPALLKCLSKQEGVDFEAVIADGGSTDGTRQVLSELKRAVPFPLLVIETPRGRAKQLNAAAEAARGEFLLFLHADSTFREPSALSAAMECFQALLLRSDHDRVAGHFALRFSRQERSPSLAFFYYEAKAALDRGGCTHGDQGFLLPRRFWREIGPFDESLPVLEDTFFAESVRRRGRWVLLPAEIWTSARRFEVEGLRPRQILNALIMNFAAIGWVDFFREASHIYRRQDAADRLRLLPFLQLIRQLLRPLSPGRRFRLWYRTGRYVRPNAWQIAFFVDVLLAYRSGVAPSQLSTKVLDRFEPFFERTTDNIPGRFAAMLLVRFWFQLTFLWYLLRDDG